MLLYNLVYRGKTCDNVTNLAVGKQITMFNFLSTSTRLDVATRFSERGATPCLMRINIPKGNPLPFISKSMDPNMSESEVLLPAGSTFKLMNKSIVNINDVDYNLYDFTLIRFGPIETRNFWLTYNKLAERLYQEYSNTEPLGMDIDGGSSKKSMRKRIKIKSTKKGKIYKNKNTKKRKNI